MGKIKKIIEIVPASPKSSYSLTPILRQMYYFFQLNPSSTSHNTPYEVHMGKVYPLNEISSVVNRIIARYEILRTNFVEENGVPFQVVKPNLIIDIDFYDVKAIPFQQITEHFIRPFDLSSDALVRAAYIELNDGSSSLLIDQPHIITDARSLEVIEKEIKSLLAGEELPEVKLQFKDYSEWINAIRETSYYKEQEQYWLDLYSDEVPVLELPYDSKPVSSLDKSGNKISFALSDEEARVLNFYSKDGNTLFIIAFGFFNIFLNKITNQEDIIVGIPVAGRQREDLMDMPGMFVNTIVLRTPLDKRITITDFLAGTKNSVIKALDNQEYLLEDLISSISFARIPGRNPLFDVMFNYLEANVKYGELPGNTNKLNKHLDVEAKFDLSFNVKKYTDIVECGFEYLSDRFKPSTIDRFIQYFKKTIKQVIKNPGIRIPDIEIISEQEKNRILFDFNSTERYYPQSQLLPQLFEKQVENKCDKVALVFNDIYLTYGDLYNQANILADLLLRKGIKPNSGVGIHVGRSHQMIVAVLGVLKAGGYYIPIDNQYPEERKKYILKDSSIDFLIIDDSPALNDYQGEIINLQSLLKSSENVPNSVIRNKPNDIAYIIYTSGTTGNPKGVMVEHQNYLNTFYSWFEQYKLSEIEVNLLQMANFSFDVFAGDLVRSLLSGGKLVVCPKETLLDFEDLYKILKRQRISLFESTPGLIVPFIGYIYEYKYKLEYLKLLIVGSDSFKVQDFLDIKKVFNNCDVRVINSYGLTETTIDTSFFEEGVSYKFKGGVVPIGKPMKNMSFYILNHSNKVQPIGVPGELCIGGKGVSRGYLNNGNLTSEKFMVNPFKSDELLFKTGDLACWLPDGNVEFLGRMDHQVKIRGFRVELGEIENTLSKHENIKESVVIALDNGRGEKYLCAYVVAKECKNDLVKSSKEFLSGSLPAYMIPSYFMEIEKVPLTANGKINRKELPIPEIKATEDYIAPANKVEEKLVEIWSVVLSIDKKEISTDSSFFTIGGHSLKATVLLARIHKEFDARIAMSDFFMNSTIKNISLLIKVSGVDKFEPIKNVERKEYYPVSSPQKRMYLSQQVDADSVVYNMPFAIYLDKEIDKEKVKEVFSKLFSRHDSLRTSFVVHGDELVQVIHKKVNCQIEYLKIDKSEEIEERRKFVRPFDLTKAPLLRVALFEIIDKGYLLMIDTHHIICDGVSQLIIEHEFSDLYTGEALSPLKLQYKDYSRWLSCEDQQARIKEQGKYWINRFSHELPVLNLPVDFVRPPLQSYDGASVDFILTEVETKKIKSITEGNDITLYMVLLAIYNVLLSKLSGQHDIIVGTPMASRLHSDLDGIVGMFVNTIAMFNSPSSDKTFKNFLSELKKNILDAFENQDFQFDDLVERVLENRDTSRNPVFDVMFNLLTEADYSGELLLLSPGESYIHRKGTSKFDLNLTAVDFDTKLIFNLEYSTKLFTEGTINRFIKYFKNIVDQISDKYNKPISSIELVNEKEKIEILNIFNNTRSYYPHDKLIHQLFEDQVEKYPEKTALTYNEKKFTYIEFNNISNNIANLIVNKGVLEGSIVAIIADRSIDLVVGIYGILKAGSAYLPISPDFPKDRIKYIISDSNCKLVLTQNHSVDLIEDDIEKICIDQLSFSNIETYNIKTRIRSSNLSHVLYTSGSTGKPKGVSIPHRVLVNSMYSMEKLYPIGNNGSYLFKTPVVFDVSTSELFGWYLGGGSLVVTDQDSHKDAELLKCYIEHYKISHINFVPSMLNAFMEYIDESDVQKLSSLKYVFVAGEELSKGIVSKFYELFKETKLENIYGPTESFYVTRFSSDNYKNEALVPIGVPFDNIKVYILDKLNNLQPVGVAGELCIGGTGLALGYINNPTLTSDKFEVNPFDRGQKLYRTGDLARWLPNGNVEFLGRIDYQVKIRGFRIELGEIGNVLLKYHSINECVVTAREDNGEKYLCAYVISDEEINEALLRGHLLKFLPEYMVPAYYVQVEEFPVTSNGKLNRIALPKPVLRATEDFVKPSNKIEERLLKIWSDVLIASNESVSVTASFFTIGGHSLKAIILLAKIHKEFNVQISMRDFLSKPTVKGVAEIITKSKYNQFESINNIEKREYYALSAQQKRIFVIQQMDKSSTMYNVISQVFLNERYDIKSVSEVIDKIVQRHEILRSGFEYINNFPVQKVYNHVRVNIECFNIGKEMPDDIVDSFMKPFDLAKPPIFRVVLLHTKNSNMLVLDMHHIITDALSIDIFTSEFNCLINNKSIKNLKLQYKDYAKWNNQILNSDLVNIQKNYWLDVYKDKIPRLNLPYDNIEDNSKKAKLISFKIDKELSNTLYSIASREGVTVFSLMLTITAILISKVSNENDIVVGLPVSGRTHDDLMDVFGFFVNTIALRLFPFGNKKFVEYLNEVKEKYLQAFDNQQYQYDNLVEELMEFHKSKDRNLFKIMFTANDLRGSEEKLDANVEKGLENINNSAKCDLIISCTFFTDNISIDIEYDSSRFKSDTIIRFTNYIQEIVKKVIQDVNVPINDIIISHDLQVIEPRNTEIEFEI